jgi:hypothetical protein
MLAMVVKKSPQARKPSARAAVRPKDWREALRAHLAKVPEVDGVFMSAEKNVIHVYSVVLEFNDRLYKRLLKQESLIEKGFPEIAFEFHTRAHQGREPHFAVPFDAEQVFLR